MTSHSNATRRDLERLRYRKNIRHLTDRELNDLRVAYERLYAISATTDDDGNVDDPAGNAADERGYQWIAGVHGAPVPVYCEHGSRQFLTWHRAYLYFFERLLQDQVPTVALPWWDWTAEISVAEGLPEAVTASTYTDLDSGEEKPNPLAAAYSQQGGETTERQPSPSGQLQQLADMVEFANAQTEFIEFSQDLENPHNSLHVWVGGDMASVPTAAYDPIFWMHHANVDRFWFMWQQEHPNALVPDDVADFVCAPFNLTGADVLDATSLGYGYVDSESLVSAVDLRALDAAPEEPPDEEAHDAEEAEEEAPEPVETMTFTLDGVERPFRRATLEFTGLTPPDHSHEIHVFLNRPDATLETPRDPGEHFAGTLALFGHGHCLGGPGHCDVLDRERPFDRRPEHHLTPRDVRLDISFPLVSLVDERDGALDQVECTLVAADEAGEPGDLRAIGFEALGITTRA